jgi:NADP-dependent 3-hydroxy acid dehydrogenase YdfG
MAVTWRRALVTGASSGTGEALARRLQVAGRLVPVGALRRGTGLVAGRVR